MTDDALGTTLTRRSIMTIATTAALAPAAALLAATASQATEGPKPAEAPHPVLELRQYKIIPGRRDAFINLFEREFVDSQEALGIRMLGTFRNLDDPNRFTWLREFPNMSERAKALNAFYFGPVWAAHRNEANPMLDDNDNVLLLRPSSKTADLGNVERDGRSAGLVVATVHYLWKDPTDGFAAFFAERVAPALARAGLPVLGSFIPESEPNNFPRLPVRQDEKLFAWFTRVPDEERYRSARKALRRGPGWESAVGPMLADFEERDAQVLKLQPTPRSRLR